MNHKVEKQHRRSIRLKGYDYASSGAYFVIIVTQGRACLFGEVVDGEMRPNQFGRIVQATWNELPHHYRGVRCDAFVVMPNHIHGVIGLVDDEGVGAGCRKSSGGSKHFLPAALTNYAKLAVYRSGNVTIMNM